MKRRILEIGPSAYRSRGGMATVVQGILHDPLLHAKYDITAYESFIDGCAPVRLVFSVYALLKFCVLPKKHDLYHIHVSCNTSVYRKACYLKSIRRAGKKVIVHVHGSRFLPFFDHLSPRRKRFVIRFLCEADCVIALSESLRQEFIQQFGLDNCIAVHNGIDTTAYAEAQSDAPSNTFLFLGRMGKRKGVYDLLAAAATLKARKVAFQCMLAGDGEIAQVRRFIENHHLSDCVQCIGWVGPEERMRLLRRCAVLVLPSYHEGLPMAILEAMAAGKAIISTTVGAIPEVIVPGKNGLLLPPGQTDALSEAMETCCMQPDMVRQMGQYNIRQINQSFSRQHMHEQLMSCFDRILAE